MNKYKNDTFNDGFLEYGFDQTERSENRKSSGKVFKSHGRLAYSELSAREQDYQLAGWMNKKLDLKVKTLYPPNLRTVDKSKLKVVISNMKYDVIKVDPDRKKGNLYFYLQEVGEEIE